MKKLLYIGHHLHLKTKSTVFLKDIFRQEFEVSELPVDPDNIDGNLANFSKDDFDVVVIFQLDFLAPIFIAKGIPTVVVPMFDGSENMPPRHWELSNQAHFISFSLSLHLKILRAGGKSLLVKYFPELPVACEPKAFKTLDGFFWERRPDTGLNAHFIKKLAGEQLKTLHLHLSPDIADLPTTNPRGLFKTTKTSVSKWFEDKKDLEKVMSSCNIYFAPRISEGIGMGFLEAMARGMAVFAYDTSTHNEYISNWETGVLYNFSLEQPVHFDNNLLKQMGAAAQQYIVDGRPIWLSQIPEILDWVHRTPVPEMADISVEFLATEIPRAYCNGFQTYTQFLSRNSLLARKMSPELDLLREINAPYVKADDRARSGDIPVFTGNRLRFGLSGTRDYLGKGWSHDEEQFVWIDGSSASVHFLADSQNINSGEIAVQCHALHFDTPQRVAVIINGTLADMLTVYDRVETHYIKLPNGLSGGLNDVTFYAEQTGSPNGETRKLSLAVHHIDFVY